ncbi:hypothetical protein Ancab_034230 [Ancistrocladus abbreviatus]
MVRDSKRSIIHEIVQFINLVDGLCVSRHTHVNEVTMNAQLVRNDYQKRDLRSARDSRKCCQNDASSRHHGLDVDVKKVTESLRKGVEMTYPHIRILEEGGENLEWLKDYVDDNGVIVGEGNGNHKLKNGILVRHGLHPNVEKHACFVEDGNLTGVDEKEKSTSGNFDECLA